MLVFFTNFMESQVRYLAFFFLFSVIDSFEWFWTDSLHQNTQVMLQKLKAPFLVLQFFYYTLITLMLFVILLSMLMMLISFGIAIKHMICSNNLNWILNLNVICKTLDWGKMWPVDFSAGKSKLVLFDRSNNNGSTDVEMDGSVMVPLIATWNC